MATALDENPYAIRKTQAMPKHSLFGTSLEIYNEKEKQQIKNPDAETFKLPVVGKKSKGEELVAQRRHEFQERQKATESARRNLKVLEQDAILMCTGVPKRMSSSRDVFSVNKGETTNRVLWISPKDIEHAQEINFGCMPDIHRNYNRDRFGRPPPIYQNPAIRSALPSREQPVVSQGQILHQNRRRSNRNRDSQEVIEFKEPVDSPTCIDVPPNIRHGFGSKVVDSLLSDEQKVFSTIEKQKLALKLPLQNHPDGSAIDLNLDKNGDYSMMGNAMRQNVFPGYSMGNAQSFTKSVYNDQVYLHRNPDTDEYRYKRDHLSTWAEHNVLRDRMKKAWDTKMAEKSAKKLAQ